MAYNSYNAILSIISSTPTDYFLELQQDINDNTFEMSVDYNTVKVKNRSTGVYTDLGVRVLSVYNDNSSINDDFKKIVFKEINYNIKLGDIFEFDNFRWMVISTNAKKTAQSYCSVQRCNTQLRFTASTPITSNIISIDGIATNIIGGNDESPIIVLPVGSIEVRIPNDDNAKKIRYSPKPTRFLLGNQDWQGQYQNWIVENIDSITNVKRTIDTVSDDSDGFIKIRLKLSQSNTKKDNHTDRVAYQDYFT